MRLPIKNWDDVLMFGKYKHKTIQWVFENNPSYILWLREENVCEVDEEIYDVSVLKDMENSPPEDYVWQPD